ncbi:MAG TPA: DUF3866 family protein [Solirubrobacterales bacterium]|nr:DUF3866 family protein [Solirubrobacterales bacterium]
MVEEDPLTVEIAGERRPAWADLGLVGEIRLGDEVVVNVEARDLGLGSGGFDLIHVNLTRGLEGAGPSGEHVMKLNYSSLQHPVRPVEGEIATPPAAADASPTAPATGSTARTAAAGVPVLVLPLHGHLAPAAFAAAHAAAVPPDPADPTPAGGVRVGFIQAGGGALPGALSRDVSTLRKRGLLCGHITAGASYGGEHEAISLPGAIEAAAGNLGWDLIIVGPGPGILGSATRLGHGGMAAMDAAHAALALGADVVLAPRLSATDPRGRHRGLSHHTATVLELLLSPVTVPIPSSADAAGIEAEIDAVGGAHRHRVVPAAVDLVAYAAAGLPRRTMGRDLAQDPLFFAAPLAAGTVLATRRAPPS